MRLSLFLVATLTLGCGDDVDPADAGRDLAIDVPTQEVDAGPWDVGRDLAPIVFDGGRDARVRDVGPDAPRGHRPSMRVLDDSPCQPWETVDSPPPRALPTGFAVVSAMFVWRVLSCAIGPQHSDAHLPRLSAYEQMSAAFEVSEGATLVGLPFNSDALLGEEGRDEGSADFDVSDNLPRLRSLRTVGSSLRRSPAEFASLASQDENHAGSLFVKTFLLVAPRSQPKGPRNGTARSRKTADS